MWVPIPEGFTTSMAAEAIRRVLGPLYGEAAARKWSVVPCKHCGAGD